MGLPAGTPQITALWSRLEKTHSPYSWGDKKQFFFFSLYYGGEITWTEFVRIESHESSLTSQWTDICHVELNM